MIFFVLSTKGRDGDDNTKSWDRETNKILKSMSMGNKYRNWYPCIRCNNIRTNQQSGTMADDKNQSRATMEQEDNLSDPVFDDMAMPDLDERRRFFEVCRESFALNVQINRKGERLGLVANYVGFDDWKVYISLLLQMGFVDLHDDTAVRELTSYTTFGTAGGSWSYSSDTDGRISILHLAPRNLCDLPAGIRQLDYLKRLCIFSQNFESLPLKELSMLPQFESLYLGGCSNRLSDSFLAQTSVNFPHLKSLSLCGRPSFQIIYRCVALEHLAVFFGEENEIDRILEVLQSPDLCFTETLRSIEFTGGHCQMKDHHYETLLFDIVPKFSSLEKMEFLGCTLDIRSFKIIADRIRCEKSSIGSNRCLRTVRFFGYYSLEELEKINNDSDIKSALLTFLKSYIAVDHIDVPRGIRIHPEWEHTLITNMVGRRVLEGRGIGDNGNGGCGLPLSVWPLILQRAQQKCDERFTCEQSSTRAKATGVYYLLREGPALIGRRLLADNPDACPPPPPSKRQRQE